MLSLNAALSGLVPTVLLPVGALPVELPLPADIVVVEPAAICEYPWSLSGWFQKKFASLT